jgi:gamma-glutamyltranspeptidase / glutathione hydrolase
MTHSLGMPSGVITKGLGFMYNGCMGVFDPRPGRTGSLAPGKARFSSICPSIIFESDKPVLVIGAPGATRIAMGVLQATLNVLDFGMTMPEAVSSPRFSATSNVIDLSNRIPRSTERELVDLGYQTVRSPLSFWARVSVPKYDDNALVSRGSPDRDGSQCRVSLAANEA